MSNKNILVTGGLGILGASLVKKLNKKKFIIFMYWIDQKIFKK